MSPEHYRLLFDASPHPYWLVDVDTLRFVAANPAAVGRYGYSEREFLALRLTDIDVDVNAESMADLLRGLQPAECLSQTSLHRTASGLGIWAETTFCRVPAPIEGHRAVFVSAIDITARRHAEQELRESEQRYRALIDATAQVVWTANADGMMIEDSPTWRAFTSQSYDEWRGHGWLDAVHPDDRGRAAEQWRESVAGQRTLDGEYRVRRADGGYSWTAMRATPVFDAAGAIREWVGTNTDITPAIRSRDALKRSEQRFRTMVESFSLIIWTSCADGRITEEVPRWQRFTGQHYSEYRDYGWLQAVHPDDRQGLLAAMQSGQARRSPVEHGLRLRRADGEYRHVLAHGAPILDAEGEIREWVGTIVDVHDQKHAEEELRRYSAELEAAGRRKDEFLAMLAHELRNPLAPIKSALEVMRRVPDPNPTVEWGRELIERQVGQMVRLVDDLLDAARVTQGKITLHRKKISLADLIEPAVETSRPLIERHGQQLTIVLPPYPVHIEGDPMRLSQVVANLLNNASKYTQRGGNILLRAESSADTVTLTVQDDGRGIPPELLPHIFDLFTQGDQSLARLQGGLGVGLTLVRRLVEMHGGAVQASSPGPGRGSAFTVRLPAAPAAPEPMTEMIAQARGKVAAASQRILIVDDNADTVQATSRLLRSMGHEVRIAFDGPAALQVASEFSPDLVLLDIGLPGMDGFEVIRHLRESSPAHQPVVAAMTGYGQEEVRRRTEAAGFNYHLVKPVDPDLLVALVATVAEEPHTLDES